MSSNKTSATANKANNYQYSSFWFYLGHVLAFSMCAMFVYLIPYARSGERLYPAAIYDLLFTEKLSEYAHFKQDMPVSTFIGPALISSVTRLVTTVFDGRIRALILEKLSARLPQHLLPSLRLHLVETRFFSLLVARVVMCAAFVAALGFYRHQVALKEKSAVTPRLLTLFFTCTAYAAYTAGSLQAQSFSSILYLVSLGFLSKDQYNRAFSCLAVNAALFDGVFGSAALIAFLVASIRRKGFNIAKVVPSALLSFVAAAGLSLVFDSIFYNKFIWPQGEAILSFVGAFKLPALKSQETIICGVGAAVSLILSFALKGDGFGSSCAVTQALALLAAPLCGRQFTSLEIVPLLSVSILAHWTGADLKSSSVLRKVFAVSKILAFLALPFLAVPLIIRTAGTQMYGADALMAINGKAVESVLGGSVVRIHLDREAQLQGHSRFLQLSHANALYSTSLVEEEVVSFRPDYLIRSAKYCKNGKAMKTFKSFEEFKMKPVSIGVHSLADLKKLNVQFLQADRIGVFRAAQCELADFEQGSLKAPVSGVTATGKLVSKHIFGDKLSSVGEQRVFIAEKTGRFNHKKIANMVGIVAYLYTTILEQI